MSSLVLSFYDKTQESHISTTGVYSVSITCVYFGAMQRHCGWTFQAKRELVRSIAQCTINGRRYSWRSSTLPTRTSRLNRRRTSRERSVCRRGRWRSGSRIDALRTVVRSIREMLRTTWLHSTSSSSCCCNNRLHGCDLCSLIDHCAWWSGPILEHSVLDTWTKLDHTVCT